MQLEAIRRLHANLCKIAQDIGDCFSTWILFTCGTMLVMVVLVFSVITFNAMQFENKMSEADRLTIMMFVLGLVVALSRVYFICLAANGVQAEVFVR